MSKKSYSVFGICAMIVLASAGYIAISIITTIIPGLVAMLISQKAFNEAMDA